MNGKFLTFFSLLIFSQSLAQLDPRERASDYALKTPINDSLNTTPRTDRPADSLKIYNPVIGDYNFWTEKMVKQQVDTALTIDNFYRQNVYQKDLFEYQTFPNWGQTLNPLKPVTIDDNLQLLPLGKSWMYVKNEDVRYYDVKTPLTELILENGVKEGQFLSTTFAHNIHSRWNYAINYRYLKSQGSYLNSLTNNSNIVFSTNYKTENNRYNLQANFVTHDFNNQENAGLTDESLNDFIQNNPNFSNRERMYINAYNGQSKFDERRVNLNHTFGLFSLSHKTTNDSIQDTLIVKREFPLYIKHQLDYRHQALEFNERSPDNFYPGPVFGIRRYNRKKFDKLENRVSLGFQWSERLSVEGGLIHQMLRFKNDSTAVVNGYVVPESVEENRLGFQGNLKFDWRKNIILTAEASYTRGNIFGNLYNVNADIVLVPFQNYTLNGGVRLNSSYPSLNYFMHQSFYENFNYYNPDFTNQTTSELFAELTAQHLGLTVFGSVINQSNPVYISSDYMPVQLDGAVNYLRLGGREHFKYRKFGFDIEAQFQKVLQNAEILPLPDVIARATVYYDTRAFKDHAHIQTGLTAHYYTSFDSREFFPILNEFMIASNGNERAIGNYPALDVFFNMKVDRMRFYIRGLNLTSFLLPGEYFSTPLQPAMDFKIQLGIHWFLFS